MNVGNLFNSKWGVEKWMDVANRGQILKYEGKDGNNVPEFSFAKDSSGEFITKTFDYNYYFSQAWRLQVGVKYTF